MKLALPFLDPVISVMKTPVMAMLELSLFLCH